MTAPQPGRLNKSLLRRVTNRICSLLARFSPGSTSLRPLLHRLRGVRIGQRVFIGDEVYLDNEYPEMIEIGDDVQISIRAIVIAHTRAPGRVIIEPRAFIGANVVLVAGGGKALRIGEGAVVGAGAVVTRSVPAHLYVAPAPIQPLARVGLPLPLAKNMDEFKAALSPLSRPPSDPGSR